ncbi:MAG: hypothetical protein KDI68_12085 [Gammaproteobacteria bacterium]|nr:hypothetical protein [Gammaproteobacteria bacterium]
MPADQRALLECYQRLDQKGRETLQAFAEFLAERNEGSGQEPQQGDAAPRTPRSIPRPRKESVIGAIKRLSETYPMIDRADLLTETSSLMSAHIMHGRNAHEIIDDLEALFDNHYKKYLAGSG